MYISHNQYKYIIISDLKDQRWVQIHSYLRYRITVFQFVLVLNCQWIYVSLNMHYNNKHIVFSETLILEVLHQFMSINEQQYIAKTLH